MSQILQAETADLLSKLMSERIPVQAFLFSKAGTRVSFFGFVDSITRDNGVLISASGAPIDLSRGYFNFLPFDRGCEFSYGETRELPEELQLSLKDTRGKSCLMFFFPKLGDRFALFFTV
jgi:hypothetical protein